MFWSAKGQAAVHNYWQSKVVKNLNFKKLFPGISGKIWGAQLRERERPTDLFGRTHEKTMTFLLLRVIN